MSEDDTLEAIRERKREQIRERVETETQESPSEPVAVDSRAEFSAAVDSHDVVLVDFYADWCGPCQMLEPVVESIAADTRATVTKVDVDANQALASEFGVQGVPTLLLFVDGEPVERLVGMQQKSQLRALVEAYS
ncbi:MULTISPECIES: thioredoxin [Haloarcula]|uniref:Thiol reductase thioredoxin n=1 Tax=Haloarcula pellucida TaxID=1427151 RepID=A0A830GMF4_9EURY|nr:MULTISPECIES: thioredoxin [Halomicroarcula]MBX0349984.1 thioredoxin [Halomicroarcula pellucida]MDS0279733.1 thioredoxin [Halomicroarcula sp. S1AR25-4]GGN95377.1 thiol reductase thioredoxin [Halomicroarcula pellucida]